MIYLVRQGETDWNLNKRFNGLTEIELNETGIAQAKQQAENLKNINFDLCFSSPQKRTKQTAEIIYKGDIVFDDRLSEINCGDFEGTKETAESMNLFWKAVMTGDKGTESFKIFLKRNCDFCHMLLDKFKNKNILIITHAANIRVLHYYFTGQPKNYDFSKPIIKSGEIITYNIQ